MSTDKTLKLGLLVTGVAISSAWAIGRGQPAHMTWPDGTPMEVASTESTSSSNVSTVSWDLPVTRNSHVDAHIKFLQGRNAKLTERWLERSGRYTPLIKTELHKRGMPEDLVYLAFIESGFNPNAKSHAAAVGLWQFIKDTGKRYGMEVTPYVDERRDPYKATAGALDYLQELYDRFGSWYLAAAAYNTGENRVARIMREETGSERGSDNDFWRIASRLPEETRNYVPLMLAAGHIGKEPAKFGFDDVDYQTPLTFSTIRVPADVPLKAVAKAIGVADTVVYGLNPELVQQQTPPNREWQVRVPENSSEKFSANFATALHEVRVAQVQEARLAKLKEKSVKKYASTGSRVHTVKRGETLSEIAKRYHVTVRALTRANGGLLASKLQVGKKLRVPKSA